MALPVAHETWFLDDPYDLEWSFISEGLTHALLGVALGIALLLRLVDRYRDGVDVPWLARGALHPFCDSDLSCGLARGTAVARVLPLDRGRSSLGRLPRSAEEHVDLSQILGQLANLRRQPLVPQALGLRTLQSQHPNLPRSVVTPSNAGLLCLEDQDGELDSEAQTFRGE